MKTTIDIADALLARAKRLAAQRETTLKQVIEDALREELRKGARSRPQPRLVTHSVRGRGLRPGLSWDDWQTMRDLAYEGRGA
jgi:hypothetical protein